MADTLWLEGEQLSVQGEPSKPGISERGEYNPSIFGVIHEIANATEKNSWLLPTCLAEQGQQDISSVRKQPVQWV